MAANFNANLQYSHKKFLTFLGKCKALYTEHIAHSDPRYQLYSSGLFSPGHSGPHFFLMSQKV